MMDISCILDTSEYYDIFDEMGYNSIHAEFIELGLDIDDEEAFTEDHVDTSGKIRGAIGRSIDTTKDIANIYGDVTDAGGDAIYQGVKLGTSALGMAGKILSFIFKLIGYIPKAINAIISKISKTHTNIKHRLQGKIALWVTEKDVEYFKNNILGEIERYIRLLKELCDAGETWGEKLEKDNSKTFKELGIIHAKLVTIRYTRSEITIKTDQAYETYFKPGTSYYTNLKGTIKSFQTHQAFFKELQEIMQTKLVKSDDLKGRHRIKVQRSLVMINEFSKVIAQYLKYLLEDMKSINGAINRAMKYQEQN